MMICQTFLKTTVKKLTTQPLKCGPYRFSKFYRPFWKTLYIRYNSIDLIVGFYNMIVLYLKFYFEHNFPYKKCSKWSSSTQIHKFILFTIFKLNVVQCFFRSCFNCHIDSHFQFIYIFHWTSFVNVVFHVSP